MPGPLPPDKVQVSFVCTQETSERLTQIAKAQGKSKSELVAQMVEEQLDAEEMVIGAIQKTIWSEKKDMKGFRKALERSFMDAMKKQLQPLADLEKLQKAKKASPKKKA